MQQRRFVVNEAAWLLCPHCEDPAADFESIIDGPKNDDRVLCAKCGAVTRPSEMVKGAVANSRRAEVWR